VQVYDRPQGRFVNPARRLGMLRSLIILAAGILIGAMVATSFTTERGAETRRRVRERIRVRRNGNGYTPEDEPLYDERMRVEEPAI
jgi:hypothetical protein